MCNIRRPDWPDAQVGQHEQRKQNDRDRDYVSSSWIHERTTEGFYDTASHRSQQASQHQTVYQKDTTLPKRRCPRRCKPMNYNGAIEYRKPNDAPTTKPWPSVKNMLADTTPLLNAIHPEEDDE